jgi:hypothetical protein
MGLCLNFNKLNGKDFLINSQQAAQLFEVPKIGALFNKLDFLGFSNYPTVSSSSCSSKGIWRCSWQDCLRCCGCQNWCSAGIAVLLLHVILGHVHASPACCLPGLLPAPPLHTHLLLPPPR